VLPDIYYHVYTHANGNENLFREEKNYAYFLQRYAFHISPIADTYAYCLMPNHLHLLLRIKDVACLQTVWEQKYPSKPIASFKTLEVFENLQGLSSQQFSNLFNSYTKAYNKMYGRKGSLFIPNFKRKEIKNESYFRNLIHYIHNNPVHHGFVHDLAEWTWSSYQAFLLEKPTLLRRKDVLEWFDGREGLQKFHRQPHDAKWVLEMGY
jgi:putative transposase